MLLRRGWRFELEKERSEETGETGGGFEEMGGTKDGFEEIEEVEQMNFEHSD